MGIINIIPFIMGLGIACIGLLVIFQCIMDKEYKYLLPSIPMTILGGYIMFIIYEQWIDISLWQKMYGG